MWRFQPSSFSWNSLKPSGPDMSSAYAGSKAVSPWPARAPNIQVINHADKMTKHNTRSNKYGSSMAGYLPAAIECLVQSGEIN